MLSVRQMPYCLFAPFFLKYFALPLVDAASTVKAASVNETFDSLNFEDFDCYGSDTEKGWRNGCDYLLSELKRDPALPDFLSFTEDIVPWYYPPRGPRSFSCELRIELEPGSGRGSVPKRDIQTIIEDIIVLCVDQGDQEGGYCREVGSNEGLRVTLGKTPIPEDVSKQINEGWNISKPQNTFWGGGGQSGERGSIKAAGNRHSQHWL